MLTIVAHLSCTIGRTICRPDPLMRSLHQSHRTFSKTRRFSSTTQSWPTRPVILKSSGLWQYKWNATEEVLFWLWYLVNACCHLAFFFEFFSSLLLLVADYSCCTPCNPGPLHRWVSYFLASDLPYLCSKLQFRASWAEYVGREIRKEGRKVGGKERWLIGC